MADYSKLLAGVRGSSPQYTSSLLSEIRENALGLAFNAPNVMSQINDYIAKFRAKSKVVAVKADVVAHSMGGIIVRTMATSLSDFANDQNFGTGLVNKLITIGTPHLGTPLAQQILADANTCVRNKMADRQLISLSSVTVSGVQVNGAVGDLQGDGFGGELSAALSSFSNSEPFPTAYVDGLMNAANLSTVQCVACNSTELDLACAADPLAHELTKDNWPDVFSQGSDAVVPVLSQTNKTSNAGSPLEFTGVIHSSGMLGLDFSGPTELDRASGIPVEVINLLNEAKDGPDFHGSTTPVGVID